MALDAAAALAGTKEHAAPAVEQAGPLAKALGDKTPVETQLEVLGVLARPLRTLGRGDELKPIQARLDKIDADRDKEYLAKSPPFKATPFAGRKDKSDRAVVMELFTGAQCPPCVAADVAFDALQKAYKPTDLVLIQYHLHIPGPDPLTNPDAVARCQVLRGEQHPEHVLQRRPGGRGGGGMANAETKFKQYGGIIDPLLEKTTDVKVGRQGDPHGRQGRHRRRGRPNADGEDMKLRLLVVEENVKYVGGNQLRFHHQVVRAMPGGADGVAVKDKAIKHTATVDLGEVRKGLTKYLDDYAEGPAVPEPRPADGHEQAAGDRPGAERQDPGDPPGGADGRRGRHAGESR